MEDRLLVGGGPSQSLACRSSLLRSLEIFQRIDLVKKKKKKKRFHAGTRRLFIAFQLFCCIHADLSLYFEILLSGYLVHYMLLLIVLSLVSKCMITLLSVFFLTHFMILVIVCVNLYVRSWCLDIGSATCTHMQELIKWILLGCITNDVFVYKCGYVLHFTPSLCFATQNIS